MIYVIILLVLTAVFFVRSLAALGGFLKWHKKELLVGTVGELEELRASGKSRKYAYVFTIERGTEIIETRIYCMRLSAGESRYRPGEAFPVWYDPQTSRYRVKKEVVRGLRLNTLLFIVFGAAAFGVYSLAPMYTLSYLVF